MPNPTSKGEDLLPKVSYPISVSQKSSQPEATCSCCTPSAVVSIQEQVPVAPVPDRSAGVWHKIRGAVMFAIACLTSPCCTPLLVPLALALLAGTPVALWMSAHLGWIFGGLTLISAVSFVLGLRWFGAKIQPSNAAKSISNVTFDSNDLKIPGGMLMSQQESP